MNNRINEEVARILNDQKITSPPIPIEEIIINLGIGIEKNNFDDEISGFLYKSGKEQIIVVNTSHPIARQNFTLAHELGHYILNHSGEIFVDNIFFRDSNSKKGINKNEIEANKFAAELLMPEEMVLDQLKKEKFNPIELYDDLDNTKLDKLAKKFCVSKKAFIIRLNNLGLVM